MPSRPVITRVGLLALLACLLAVPRLSGGSGGGGASAGSAQSPDAAKSRYGFALQEVGKSAGITFTHHSPKLDAKLDHIMPQVASMGAAVAVVDFDRDGWQDLYVINSGEGTKNALYRNRHDGTFEDVAGAVGLADLNVPG